MAFTINKIRNEDGNWATRLMDASYLRQARRMQTQASLRSSNYSATQNFLNLEDITNDMIIGDVTAGA